mgnify:FL=1|tara:strand:+ start:320 stop:817 length:498 start_codon:yes stop_codon:yes gene_type:complete
MKKLILVLLITLACESKKQERVKEVKTEFIVKIKYRVSKEDVIKLVLYNITTDQNQNKWIQINEKVVGSLATKNSIANFGESISYNFRINFGTKQEKEIEIKYIEILYGAKRIYVKPEELKKYFIFNEFISQDNATNKLFTKKIGGKLNPILFLKIEYLKELEGN